MKYILLCFFILNETLLTNISFFLGFKCRREDKELRNVLGSVHYFEGKYFENFLFFFNETFLMFSFFSFCSFGRAALVHFKGNTSKSLKIYFFI